MGLNHRCDQQVWGPVENNQWNVHTIIYHYHYTITIILLPLYYYHYTITIIPLLYHYLQHTLNARTHTHTLTLTRTHAHTHTHTHTHARTHTHKHTQKWVVTYFLTCQICPIFRWVPPGTCEHPENEWSHDSLATVAKLTLAGMVWVRAPHSFSSVVSFVRGTINRLVSKETIAPVQEWVALYLRFHNSSAVCVDLCLSHISNKSLNVHSSGTETWWGEGLVHTTQLLTIHYLGNYFMIFRHDRFYGSILTQGRQVEAPTIHSITWYDHYHPHSHMT